MNKSVSIDGVTYSIQSDDDYLGWVGDDFDPHMVQLFKTLIVPGDVVADIGANIGLTALLFSSLAKTVYAFEPSASTYRFLEENLKTAHANNVVAVNVGLGSKKESSTITFSDNNRSGGFVSNLIQPKNGHITEKINIDTLGDYFNDQSTKPSFYKVDVEGFELEVVRGGVDLIKSTKPILVLEMNHFCLNVLRRVTVPDFIDFMRSVFPFLYAIDTDNSVIADLHHPDQAYMVMHEHVVRHRFPNIVGGFDEELQSKLNKIKKSVPIPIFNNNSYIDKLKNRLRNVF